MPTPRATKLIYLLCLIYIMSYQAKLNIETRSHFLHILKQYFLFVIIKKIDGAEYLGVPGTTFEAELAASVGADDAGGCQDDDDDGYDDDDGHASQAAPRPEVGEEPGHAVVTDDDVGFRIGRRAAVRPLLRAKEPLGLLLRRRVSVDVVLVKQKKAPNSKFLVKREPHFS